jgi:hypothetical protein
MDVAVDSVFGDAAADAKVHALPLGTDTGIRDLARVSGGLLVLAGSTRDEPIPASLFFWDETTDTAKKLSGPDLSDVPPSAKAETLLVLDEQPDHYRVLIMFDGIANGGPRVIFALNVIADKPLALVTMWLNNAEIIAPHDSVRLETRLPQAAFE